MKKWEGIDYRDMRDIPETVIDGLHMLDYVLKSNLGIESSKEEKEKMVYFYLVDKDGFLNEEDLSRKLIIFDETTRKRLINDMCNNLRPIVFEEI